ncbi:hypothetical protein K491DRAFT_683972 [Lophiostoma macrostomum CBS 122681]|uniref:Uncharacterized protein n=1 Tax=Lophiostoma macrostomum CBS 122681 TaxID=1314788 RepID=A0A6A6SN29_9PLEO|nr:hypothetical protein K491DRAFT_683972 [Lophiostoma macrostomum CBS 122681]
MSPTRHVLTEDTLRQLERTHPGSFSPPNKGRRRIAGQLFTPPSTVVQSDSNRSVSSSSSSKVAEYLEIPVTLYSTEALEFIGFDVKTAFSLLENWVSEPQDLETEYLYMIFRHLELLADKNDDPPEEAEKNLRKVGISEKLIHSLMDPNFEDVRKIQSLWAWLREIIYINFLTLKDLEERIVEFLKPKELSSQGPNLRGGGKEPQDYSRNIVEHTTLFRATSKGRIGNLFQADGSVALETINAEFPLPNDFSNDTTAFYWTEMSWVAEKYADYLKRNTEGADIVIIRMGCPNHILRGPPVWKLEFGDLELWKSLLWHSRLRKPYPDNIAQLHKGKEVIIGPVSMISDGSLRKMKSWTQVTANNIHRKYGEAGTQTVWIGLEAMAKVNEHVKGKVDLYTRFPSIKYVPKPAEIVGSGKS